MAEAPITLASTVVASSDQVSADLAEEVVILSLKSGEYFGLNAMGAAIWTSIQEPTRVVAMRDRFLEQYTDVEPERCTDDVLRLLEELAEVGLLEVVTPGSE